MAYRIHLQEKQSFLQVKRYLWMLLSKTLLTTLKTF
jgi:hypothetical protein